MPPSMPIMRMFVLPTTSRGATNPHEAASLNACRCEDLSLLPRRRKPIYFYRTITHTCKSCVEGNLSRVNSALYAAHEQILDEVSQCCAWMRSHMMQHVPNVISIARSRT